MQILENKRIAVCAMVVLIFLSALLGAARSLIPMRNTAQETFYAGVDGDGLGINNDLNSRAELAYNLVTVARRYVDSDTSEITAVLAARDALIDADSIGEKYRANAKLTEATGDLIEAMAAYPLSDTDARYRSTISTDLRSRNEIISHDSYNAQAQEFNQTLAAFPASLFGRLVGVKSLELFA
jgi:hypothetical protein